VIDKLVYQKQGCVEGDKILFIYCLTCHLIYFVILMGILSVTLWFRELQNCIEIPWDWARQIGQHHQLLCSS